MKVVIIAIGAGIGDSVTIGAIGARTRIVTSTDTDANTITESLCEVCK